MSKLQVRVEHALGAAEAERRIRAAADQLVAQKPDVVKSIAWSDGVAHVVGPGFEGDLRVHDRDVEIEAELGFMLSMFALKARKEGEAWLANLLR